VLGTTTIKKGTKKTRYKQKKESREEVAERGGVGIYKSNQQADPIIKSV